MIIDRIQEPLKKWFSSKLDKNIVELPNENVPEVIESEESLISWGYSFDIIITTVRDLILQYRECASNFEVALAIDDIINECIVFDEDNIVELNLDSVDLSDSIKTKITDEFNHILNLLDFNNIGDEIFRQWYVDGRLFYQNIVDPKSIKKGILKLKLLSSLDITRMIDKESGKKFFIWKLNEQEKMKRSGFLRITSDQNGDKVWQLPEQLVTFVPSGLVNQEETLYISYLHKSIKPMNQLKLIEDSAVIYRITRAPERRVFNIDVGRLPKKKAEAYVKKLIDRFKNKLTYDSGTGQISQRKNSMTMLEDFFIPTNSDQKGTKIDTLSGGTLVDKIEDIKYFKRKLYKSLNVPTNRIDNDDSPAVNFGAQGELTREELKFTKFVNKLRSKFATYLFLDLLKKQLVFKGIISIEDWNNIKNNISFDWASDSYYTQLKENEILTNNVELINSMESLIGKYVSHEFVRRNILRQSDDDIKEEDKKIEQEKNKYKTNDEESK